MPRPGGKRLRLPRPSKGLRGPTLGSGPGRTGRVGEHRRWAPAEPARVRGALKEEALRCRNRAWHGRPPRSAGPQQTASTAAPLFGALSVPPQGGRRTANAVQASRERHGGVLLVYLLAVLASYP